jgi:DNA-directed RNA polymerase specialized sigma24 family protein
MNPYSLTDADARYLYEKAGFAAYCAYRRLEREVDRDFEDAKQEAVLTFWQTWCQKGDERYSFVAARNAALESMVRHKNPYALSLDYAYDNDDRPWLERLVVDDPDDGDSDGSDWLSSSDLEGLVTCLFTAPPTEEALVNYRHILRHQLAGHSLEETARMLGWSREAVRGQFRRLVAKLAQHYGITATWQTVSARLKQDRNWDKALLAIAGKPPGARTVAYNVQILRLLVRGYDMAAIVVELGKSESAIKDARKKLKAKLVAYCQEQGIEPPAYNRNGGGWRPAHHFGNHHGRPAKPA